MIVLINPFISSMERYGRDIGDIGGHQMPLGIFYLAAALRKVQFSVEVIDAEAANLSHEEVVAHITQQKVSLIGLTSTTVAFRNTRLLAEMLRKALPTVPIVIGGPHMTAMPDETMQTNAFDFGVTNEGEIALVQLARFLLQKQGTLETIPNLYYHQENSWVKSKEQSVIAELDTIPFPARELYPDLTDYKPPVGSFRLRPVVNIITSRGCPYQCIFCDNNTFGRKTRFHSAEYVAREIIETLNRFHAREIAFIDDTFVLDKQRLRRIFALLDEKGIKFPWTCMTRVNNIDYETLKFMREHGCWQIRFGIESGNQQVLDFIKKGITLEQVCDAAHWCKELGIATVGFFMIGHHTDTKETIEETIKFALSLPLTDTVVTINTPIPGTESYALARQYGQYDEGDWTSLNYWTPVFVPHGLTSEYMVEKQAELYRRFYMRPHIILGQLAKIRSVPILLMFLRNAMLGLNFLKQSARGKSR